MNAVAKQAAVADSPANEVGNAVGRQNANKVNRAMGPLAGEAELAPLGNLSLPAAAKRCAPDGVELTEIEFHNRIRIVHVKGECNRTRGGSITAQRNRDLSRSVAVSRTKGFYF